MSVHYKFKSALDFDTITFDGLHISVSDLKKAIVHQKRLGKTTDFDLQITNAQTKEEYSENSTLIPKNTSLIIARIPIAVQAKKPWDPQAEKVQSQRTVTEPERGELDLSQMTGSEEEKIQVMIMQSTMDYDPNKYHKLKGQGQTGEVPATYRCFKCHKPGHWIKNCPLNISGDYDHKRNTGIPKSFLQERAGQPKTEDTISQPPAAEKKHEIPDDLICNICKDLFTDAVMIPCCGSSFCDECVRTALLESEDNECPDCKEKGSSPGSLIPNRFLRNSVNAFKNETGYNKIQKRKEIIKPITETLVQTHARNNGSQKNKVTVVIEETITAPPEISPIKETPTQEKKIDTYSSSHDENESDFEDNITVTVPPPLVQPHRSSLQEGYYTNRNIKNPRPPGMDNSPRHNLQSSPAEETNVNNLIPQEISVTGANDKMDHYSNHHSTPNITIQRGTQILVHRSTPNEIYGNAPPITSYPQTLTGSVHGPPAMRNYHPHNYGVHNSGYSQYNIGERMRGSYPVPRMGYHNTMPQIRPRYMHPSSNIESVYQGIAANVGTGIIDDPLEAFNRIMREKEKRKEERRRSPERRRSRSSDGRSSRPRPLPRQHLKQRQRSPQDDRRDNSPPMRDRRDRSRNRDKRNNEIDKWKRGSSSHSDRSSRSRSWSNIPRRWSKSPHNVRKRSRSRSPIFTPSRSPSRSISTGRFRGQMPPSMRYNNSPLRSISPRYRSKDTRKRRDDFKEDSPRGIRKPRSKGRSVEHLSNRQDRFIGGGNQHHNKYDGPTEYNNDRRFVRNSYRRYSRERQFDSKYNNQYNQDKNMNFKPFERYDDAPPGSEEPPPPGFEITPQLDCNSGNRNNFEEMDSYRNNDFRKLNNENKKNYRGSPQNSQNTQNSANKYHETSKYHEIPRHIKENRQRDGRSWSRISPRSPHNITNKNVIENKRRSRSRSVVRLDKFQENIDFYNENENQKHRNPPTDNYYYGNDEVLNNKIVIEGKKCDKTLERSVEKRTNYSKEEKNSLTDRKSEKASKNVQKKEKEREKDKSVRKVIESEKCKDIQEFNEEIKKDKKVKERKKKKKDKDEKEAKKKIKKKEKKEKDKVKLKDKDSSVTTNLSLEKITDITVADNPKELNFDQPEIKELNAMVKEEDKISDTNKEVVDFNLINLYSDICRDEDIKYDYIKKSPNKSSEISDIEKNIYSDVKRFDAGDFDSNLDLDELNSSEFGAKKIDSILVPLPEPSKWEKWEVDEDGQNEADEINTDAEDQNLNMTVDKSGKVTGEVLKRAENAIFKRAINAIRPAIEIKTISVDRQKLYSNEHINDIQPLPVSITVPSNKKEENDQLNIQITLPVDSPSSDSVVETKSDKLEKNQLPTTKSVKDRLGPILSKKSTPTALKKSTNIQHDIKNHQRRNKIDDRNIGRGSGQRRSEIIHQRRSNEREKFVKNKTPRHEFQQNHDFPNRRQRYPEHSRDRHTHLELGPRKVYDTYNKYDKQRPKGPDKNSGDSKRRSNSRDNKKNDNKNNKETHNKRQRSDSNSFDNREKRIKQVSDENCNSKENKSLSDNRKKYNSENNPTELKDQPSVKEKKYINNTENNDVKESDAAFKNDTNVEINTKQIDRTSKSRGHTKKSKSTSGGLTSSSSSSDSDSDTESEDRKNNKRKHKKEKKRAKRFSSTESNNSNKRKSSKNKKKNKTSKKKKSKK